jgi:hypothetical protein
VSDWIGGPFRKQSVELLAQKEYEDARRHLLECQRMRDYYEQMSAFYSTRISKLRDLLNDSAAQK